MILITTQQTSLIGSPPASSGWTVSPNGTVDIHGVGGMYDFIPGNGSYVDLDGTSLSSGLFIVSQRQFGREYDLYTFF